jgi:drug/metabolite transporter (DMT)-like permease
MTTGSVPLAPTSASAEKRETTLVPILSLTLLLWASAFVGIRYAVAYYPPGSLALLRFLIASVILGAYLYSREATAGRTKATVRDWASFLALGASGIFAYHIALNYGERTVSAGAASLLVNTTPLFTVLLAVLFLGERLSKQGALGMGVAFAGAAMVSLGTGQGLTLDRGALLVLLAAVVQAAYFTLQKPLLRRFDALSLTTRAVWCGCFLLLLFLPELVSTLRKAPLAATLVVVFLGVGPSATAYLSWAVIVSRMSVSRAVGYLYLVPALALVLGFFVLGEAPTLLSLVGGAITVAGVSLIRFAPASR